MPLLIHRDSQPGLLRMEGTFTFDAHGAFRDATLDLLATEQLPAITLDLSGVSYMDSAALGMLLLVRERAEAKGMKVVLSRPSPTLMGILKVVQFGKLFEIREQ
ncbi:MAG TPA: STAS domain-containing protein [Holophagaceae bacterium]